MSNEKKVWVGSLNAGLIRQQYLDANFPDIKQEEVNEVPLGASLIKKSEIATGVLFKIDKQYKNFNKLDILPDSLWASYVNEKPKRPNDKNYVFQIGNGQLVLNQACADVFKKFRLGQTTLTPVQIYKKENELAFETTYYFLNLCEHCHYLAEEQTNERLEFQTFRLPKPAYSTLYVKDNMVEIKSSAIECELDFWYDPLLAGCIFFSENLHNALVEAKLDKKWSMHTCKLV